MDPLTLGLIGLGAGLLKSTAVDAPREARQRTVQAETTRWSPWTGMRAPEPTPADPIGSGLSFGLTGAALGQGIQRDQAYQDYLDAKREALWGDAATSRFSGNYVGPDVVSPSPWGRMYG